MTNTSLDDHAASATSTAVAARTFDSYLWDTLTGNLRGSTAVCNGLLDCQSARRRLNWL